MQRRFLLAALTIALGLSTAAQAKTNFSGNWKLNAEKSDFGPMPPPSAMTLKIDHADPDLKLATTMAGPQGEMSYDSKYSTDGKETTNTMGPMEAKSTAKWDGDDLAVSTKIDTGGGEMTSKGKWTLSPDGKTLTQTAHLTSPQGEMDMKLVFEKQAK